MQLTHLGTRYGGWVVPLQLLTPDSVCYCVGAGEDISFDVALAEEVGCPVFTFDPTPRAIAHEEALRRSLDAGQPMCINNNPNETYGISAARYRNHFQFLPWGVYDTDEDIKFYTPRDTSHVSHSIVNLQETEEYFTARCKRLSTIMRELGHARIDLLKLDVEGAENAVLADMLAAKIYPGILSIEFDQAQNGKSMQATLELIRELCRAGYAIVHEDKWNITFVHGESGGQVASNLKYYKLAWRVFRKTLGQSRNRKAA